MILKPFQPGKYWTPRRQAWYTEHTPLGTPKGWADYLFKTAAHEFHHVREYQEGGRWAKPWSRPGPSGRRPRHDKRPEEIRAINAEHESAEKAKGDPEIQALLETLAAQLAASHERRLQWRKKKQQRSLLRLGKLLNL